MGILRQIMIYGSALLLTGCYDAFTPKVDSEPVLCINSLITAGEPVEVSVSHTWLYTDENGSLTSEVYDAVVHIFANGVEVGPDYLPREGDLMRIEANSPTYGEADAEVTVPMAAQIEALEWQTAEVDVWKDDLPGWDMLADISFNLSASLRFRDSKEVDNYYLFSYGGFPDVNFMPGTFDYESEPIFSEHIGVFDAISGNDNEGFSFFTDRQFSGKSYALTIRFLNSNYWLEMQEYDEEQLNCGFVFTLCAISESYYKWCCYRWNVDNGTLGELGDIGLSDPICGYSNVSTGAGVVLAQSKSTVTLNLKDFLKKELFEL